MRMRIVLLLCALFALTVGVATATAGGGNSATAKLCQKGGWQTLVRSDGTPFADEQACTSYGAQGGTPMPPPPPKTQAQLDCESFGEMYSSDPESNQLGFGTVVFSCLGFAPNGVNPLSSDCFSIGGGIMGPF